MIAVGCCRLHKLLGIAMKARALFLCLCVAVACLVSPAQSAKKPKHPKVSPFTRPCVADPSGAPVGTGFAGTACYLAPGFDPAALSPSASPACDPSKTVSADQKRMLAQAYRIAPDYVKQRLCRLDGLFLTTGGIDVSWGLWQKDTGGGAKFYIALADSTVANNADLNTMQKEKIATLLNIGMNDIMDARIPRFDNAAHPAFTTLATLAHELGHA